jgi:hypothetical protein
MRRANHQFNNGFVRTGTLQLLQWKKCVPRKRKGKEEGEKIPAGGGRRAAEISA